MDGVVAGLAIATSVIAVLAGLDRWMLPSIRQRQYALLTQMRDDEKDQFRGRTLDDARTTATAVQVAAFWVPSTRMWHVPAVTAAVAYACFVAPRLLVEDPQGRDVGALNWIVGAGMFACFECISLFPGYLTYMRRMAYVRAYLNVGFIDDVRVTLPRDRGVLLTLWALLLTGTATAVGVLNSGFYDGSGAAIAVCVVLAFGGLAGLITLGRHLVLVERGFMLPLRRDVIVGAPVLQEPIFGDEAPPQDPGMTPTT